MKQEVNTIKNNKNAEEKLEGKISITMIKTGSQKGIISKTILWFLFLER